VREYCLVGTTPSKRLKRMRESFNANKSILVDDYEYFTMPRESIPQSKAARRLAEQSEPQSLERSETPSSDKNGD
jgi:hypothetical protein